MAERWTEVLATWEGLNAALRSCTEAEAQELLATELAGKRRRVFVLRIHCRLNRLRGARERRELRGRLKR